MIATTLDKVQIGDSFTPDNGETNITVKNIFPVAGTTVILVLGTERDFGRNMTGDFRYWGYAGDEVIVRL